MENAPGARFSILDNDEVASRDKQQENAAEFACDDSIRWNDTHPCGFAMFYVRYQT
jgi:hypothetical protein